MACSHLYNSLEYYDLGEWFEVVYAPYRPVASIYRAAAAQLHIACLEGFHAAR